MSYRELKDDGPFVEEETEADTKEDKNGIYGGRVPIIALEVMSSRAVRHLLTLAWITNALAICTLVLDSYLFEFPLASNIVAWILWLVTILAILSNLILYMCNSAHCSNIFGRSWLRIENALRGTILISSVIMMVSFTCVVGLYSYGNTNNDHYWSGYFSLADLFMEVPTFTVGLLVCGGFATERLSIIWFYIPRILVLLSRFVVRLIVIGHCLSDRELSVMMSNSEDEISNKLFTGICRTYDDISLLLLVLLGLIALIDFFRTKRHLMNVKYMDTRFRQVVFRFIIFDLGLAMVLYFLVYWLMYAGSRFHASEWPSHFFMFKPLLLASAFVIIFIAFYPPAKTKFLCYELKDAQPFNIPWADVSLAVAASFDAYYDTPGTKEPSASSFGTIGWTRKAYRLLGGVHNNETDAHCLIAEITPAASKNIGSDQWSMRKGDIVIAFRGTASWANVKSDLTLSPEPIPFDLMLPRFALHTENSAKDTGPVTRARGLSDDFQREWSRRNTRLSKLGPVGGPHGHRKRRSFDNTKHGQRYRRVESDERERKKTPKLYEKSDFYPESKTSMPQAMPHDPSKDVSHGWQAATSEDKKRAQNEKNPDSLSWLLRERAHGGFLRLYLSLRWKLLAALDPLFAPGGVSVVAHDRKTSTSPHSSKHFSIDMKKPKYFRPLSREDKSKRLRSKVKYRKRHIFITGHSLGAALATLCSLDLHTRYTGEYKVQMVNIGSPRVGDYRFARTFDALFPNALRVVFDRDVIPGIPKFFCLFKHIGHEVTIDYQGNILIDPSPIEKAFIVKGSTSMKAHQMSTYQTGINECGKCHIPNESDQKFVADLFAKKEKKEKKTETKESDATSLDMSTDNSKMVDEKVSSNDMRIEINVKD